MIPLEQVLWLLSAICCGNILAICLHYWMWKLRLRAIDTLVAFGCLTLPLLFLVFIMNSGWVSRFGTGGRLAGIVTAYLVCLIVLGLLHSRQIPSGWYEATIACYVEHLLAFLLGRGALSAFLFVNPVGPNTPSFYETDWIAFFVFFYSIPLMFLSVFRPIVLKIGAQLLQMKADWFRLNYQWKKSKF